jgi:predicted PolB exonuclease-like 3'-5' exonuclease
MYEWDKWRWGGRHASLDALARVLGLPSSKQGMDGSRVYEEFCAGRHDEIACYCMRDVELVRRIYCRLTFSQDGIGEEKRAHEYEGEGA